MEGDLFWNGGQLTILAIGITEFQNLQIIANWGLTEIEKIGISYSQYFSFPLIHFVSLVSFYTSWKHQKTRGFPVFSGGGGEGGGGWGYGKKPVA